MQKKIVSTTLPASSVSFLSRLTEINDVSRSKAMEILIDLVQDYFTDEQLRLEFTTRDGTDHRTKKLRDN